MTGMLLLLPAWPEEWAEAGHVKGLRARGDLHASFSWQAGNVQVHHTERGTRIGNRF